jgi:serine/threonine protein kinase
VASGVDVLDRQGTTFGRRYLLLTPVNLSDIASVYLADDTVLRRRVAVKILPEGLASDETFLYRFRSAAQAAAAMNHPHIEAVYDWGEDDVPYVVSEYLGGGSLRSMLDARTLLTVSQALLVGLEAARGLEYAHRQKNVHRDIKPANLLFDDEGRLRIADFGIARALAEAGWTEQGTVVGTARYASPEQAKSDPLTGKSDVYTLGLVLIEAVTGEVPFRGDTPISTLVARIDRQVPVPKEMGPLQRVLERAGHPDPDERPDAGEFIIGLMAAAEECPRPTPLPLVGALPKQPAVGDEEPGASPRPQLDLGYPTQRYTGISDTDPIRDRASAERRDFRDDRQRAWFMRVAEHVEMIDYTFVRQQRDSPFSRSDVVVIEIDGIALIPWFMIESDPVISEINRLLNAAQFPLSALAWLVAPNAILGNRRPFEMLADTSREQLISAANNRNLEYESY